MADKSREHFLFFLEGMMRWDVENKEKQLTYSMFLKSSTDEGDIVNS